MHVIKRLVSYRIVSICKTDGAKVVRVSIKSKVERSVSESQYIFVWRVSSVVKIKTNMLRVVVKVQCIAKKI